MARAWRKEDPLIFLLSLPPDHNILFVAKKRDTAVLYNMMRQLDQCQWCLCINRAFVPIRWHRCRPFQPRLPLNAVHRSFGDFLLKAELNKPQWKQVGHNLWKSMREVVKKSYRVKVCPNSWLPTPVCPLFYNTKNWSPLCVGKFRFNVPQSL